ncbi:MAG: RimK family alpha-L-glutamate ligase [Nanoarchaeota archaeon]
MKLGVISLGGKSSRLIMEESKKYFSEVVDINIKKIDVHASSKGIIAMYDGTKLQDFDCVYIRGSHKYSMLQRAITESLQHKCYLPIIPSGFTNGHNKYFTLIELQKKNIPIPQSYVAANIEAAKKILKKAHYPLVIKIPEGTHGKGVLFADSIGSAKSIADSLEIFKQPYIIQEYIETNATDIRAIVIGNKVMAAMIRKAEKFENRANIHQGGVGIAHELDDQAEDIAVRSAMAIGADICAVDMLESDKVYVIEVNLSPGLEGITNATNKNIGGMIAEYLFKKAKEYKNSVNNSEISKILSDNQDSQEIITNLKIQSGVIKLPSIVSKVSGFKNEEEVSIISKKGRILIKR